MNPVGAKWEEFKTPTPGERFRRLRVAEPPGYFVEVVRRVDDIFPTTATGFPLPPRSYDEVVSPMTFVPDPPPPAQGRLL